VLQSDIIALASSEEVVSLSDFTKVRGRVQQVAHVQGPMLRVAFAWVTYGHGESSPHILRGRHTSVARIVRVAALIGFVEVGNAVAVRILFERIGPEAKLLQIGQEVIIEIVHAVRILIFVSIAVAGI